MIDQWSARVSRSGAAGRALLSISAPSRWRDTRILGHRVVIVRIGCLEFFLAKHTLRAISSGCITLPLGAPGLLRHPLDASEIISAT
jgi:hypothetical protein